MANTKIILQHQSDLALTGAQILEPVGIVKGDIEGLVAHLATLEAADTTTNENLNSKIATEQQSRKAAVDALQAEVDANQAASDAAELSLSNQIADIISNVDAAALDSLTEVVGAFQAADGDLSAAITAALGTHTSELGKEIADRISGDAATLASAKVYTDALEALHASDKAAADAAIVAAKATSDSEIAEAKAAADAARVAAKATSDSEIAEAKAAADAARVAAKATSDSEIAEAKAAADAARVAAKVVADDALAAETKRAEDAETGLSDDISAEAAAARAAESGLQDSIDAEIAARKAGDDAAKVASDSSIAALQAEVDANQAASDAAELSLSNQIADIISNVDAAALDSLTEVVGAFQAADGDLSAAITAALGTHTSELGKEIADRISGDAATLASAKVYTDALEALHASDKAAADAAIVAAKATSDSEIAEAKAAADAARVAAKVVADDALAAETKRAEDAETGLSDDISAEAAAARAAESGLQDSIDAEIAARIAGDDALDTRVNDAIFNSTPGVNSMDEIIKSFNDAMTMNVDDFLPSNHEVYFNAETGVAGFDDIAIKNGTLIFFINGLMTAVGNSMDYTLNQNEAKDVVGVTLLGEAKTLAENGATLSAYGVGANPVNTVTSAIVDPNGEGEGEGEGEGPIGDK